MSSSTTTQAQKPPSLFRNIVDLANSISGRPPGPVELPLIGSTLEYSRDPLRFGIEGARKYGDIFLFHILNYPIYSVNNPELMQRVLIEDNDRFEKDFGLKMLDKYLLGTGLLTAEGAAHKQMRKNSSGAFSKKRINSYAPAMAALTSDHCSTWRDGETVDIHQEMMILTQMIAAKTLFNSDVKDQATAIGRSLAEIMSLANFMLGPLILMMKSLPLPQTQRVQRATDELNGIVDRFIDEHLASPDQGDFLSMLIQAKRASGMPLDKEQLRSEAMTIFLAGHETTANGLAYTFYLLARHPEELSKVQKELKDVLGKREVSVEDVGKLTYTRQVFAESMRLYPPAWAIGRTTLDEYKLGDYLVPPNSQVWFSQYVTHRDARFFTDPERFYPDRFAEESDRPKYAYFPFSAGPRNCIGEQFAWLEGVLVLATVLRKWNFEPIKDFQLELEPSITLRPKHGINLKARGR